jgi:deazaflavin-dependent oxidoreductase (nitroreductase family)
MRCVRASARSRRGEAIQTGRKTGKARTVPVASFEDAGDGLVIASFGGSPQHLAWFNNLVAKSRVTVADFRVRLPRWSAQRVLSPRIR